MEPSLIGISAIMVGRTKEIKLLSQWFETNSVAIVSGIHGIGKTELCNKFARKIEDERKPPLMSLNGVTVESLYNSFMMVGREYGLTWENGAQNKQTVVEICNAVLECYLKDTPDKMLFMIDNVDDDEVNEVIQSIAAQIIQNRTNCFMLVNTTSRNINYSEHVIHLDVLQLEDAKQVVRNGIGKSSAGDPVPDIHLQTLAEYLQYPLALSLATGCIKMRPNFEIKEYLTEFQNVIDVDLDPIILNLIDNEYKETMLRTWNVAMNQLKNTGDVGSHAVEILKIMAYCEPEDIPTELLWRIYHKGYTGDLEFSMHILNETMSTLYEYKIIDGTGILYRLHRVYAQIIRARITVMSSEVDFLRQTVKAIDTEEVYEKLKHHDMTHVMSVWKHASKYEELIHECPTFPDRIADKLNIAEMYKEMLEFSKVNVEKLSETLNPTHLETMKMETQVAIALFKLEDHEEALLKHRVAYEKQQSILGENHEVTLLTGHNMTRVLSSLNKLNEGLELIQRLFEIQKTSLGLEHPTTLLIMGSLAEYMWDNARTDLPNKLDDLKKAKKLLEEVVELRVKVFGNDHPFTIRSKFDLALKLCGFNEITRSLELLNEVLVSVEGVVPAGLNGYPPVSTIKEAIVGVALAATKRGVGVSKAKVKTTCCVMC